MKHYYLSEEVTPLAKRMGSLNGWKKEMAQSLLKSWPSPKDQIDDLRRILGSAEPADQNSLTKQEAEAVIPLLPKAYRSKAKILLDNILKWAAQVGCSQGRACDLAGRDSNEPPR